MYKRTIKRTFSLHAALIKYILCFAYRSRYKLLLEPYSYDVAAKLPSLLTPKTHLCVPIYFYEFRRHDPIRTFYYTNLHVFFKNKKKILKTEVDNKRSMFNSYGYFQLHNWFLTSWSKIIYQQVLLVPRRTDSDAVQFKHLNDKL